MPVFEIALFACSVIAGGWLSGRRQVAEGGDINVTLFHCLSSPCSSLEEPQPPNVTLFLLRNQGLTAAIQKKLNPTANQHCFLFFPNFFSTNRFQNASGKWLLGAAALAIDCNAASLRV